MEQLKKAVRKSVTGRKMSDQFYVDGDVNVPDDKGDVGRIVYSQGMLRVEDMKQSGSYVRVSGRIQYQILYLAGGDDGSISVLQGKLPFEVWQGMVPFTYVAECRSAEAGMEYELQSTCGQPVVSLLGNGEAEIKAVLEFQIFLKRREMVSNICEIHTEPLDKKALSEAPGIVGYVMKNGDKLWDLARKYHTTEKRIREVNEIGEGEPKTGEKILIFKENLGIL